MACILIDASRLFYKLSEIKLGRKYAEKRGMKGTAADFGMDELELIAEFKRDIKKHCKRLEQCEDAALIR